MKTTNISQLQIHMLSQEQYEREARAGNLDDNALYFVPSEKITAGDIDGLNDIIQDAVNGIEIDWSVIKNKPNASTSVAGIVQLTDSVTSTSTTTAATPNSVKKAYDLAAGALPLTGGTLTGNLQVKNAAGTTVVAKIDQNGYVVGTWLQSTVHTLNYTPPYICVQDSGGLIYSRTPAQILGDIGAAPVELITVADIDAICGTTIAMASEEVF